VILESLVQISVSDPENNPMAAQISVLTATHKTVEQTTNEDGIALLTLPAGQTSIRVSAEGFAEVRRNIDLKKGQESSVLIVLAKPRVTVADDRLIINDKVFFETGSSHVAQNSYDLLDEVAIVILDHPDLMKIEVQGHTDDVGNDDNNLALSQDRAQAVVDYLIAAGVEPERLSAQGYGERQPLTDGSSEADRANNRRVEFHVLQRRN
jgi:outer membrane protein OmpA-like peptidoglycan-associated protein